MNVETVLEQMLFSTLRIEAFRPDGTTSIGSGSIVSHTWGDGKEGEFLVTNKHVIRGTSKGQLVFTLAEGDGDDIKPVLGEFVPINLDGQNWNWFGHPRKDIDIAMMPISRVAAYLTQVNRRAYYKSIPTTFVPDATALEELDAVEDVVFIGYPQGLFDEHNNLPIVRKGITATPPIIDYNGLPAFLIDASVFHGSSGSPVFIHNKGTWQTRRTTVTGADRVLFLGVLSDVYSQSEEGSLVMKEIPAALRPVPVTTQMLDLGIVHKARTVLETIDYLLQARGELKPTAPKYPAR